MLRPAMTLLSCLGLTLLVLAGPTSAQASYTVSGLALQITNDDYCDMTISGKISAKVSFVCNGFSDRPRSICMSV